MMGEGGWPLREGENTCLAPLRAAVTAEKKLSGNPGKDHPRMNQSCGGRMRVVVIGPVGSTWAPARAARKENVREEQPGTRTDGSNLSEYRCSVNGLFAGRPIRL